MLPGSQFRFPLALLLATAATACEPRPAEPEKDTPPPVTIRDSAGIRIVENHAPEWAGGDSWTIDPEPIIVIGGDPGIGVATEDSVHLIWRVTALGRLSDGRVAVLSSGSKSLRLFHPSGRLSKSIGRAGEGPGEFNHPSYLQVLPGDTLAVWSDWFGYVSYFDTAGTVVNHRRIDVGRVFDQTEIPGQSPPERIHMPLADGSFLVIVGRRDVAIPEGDEFFRPDWSFVRIDTAYAAHSLGWWGGIEQRSLRSFDLTTRWPLPLFGVISHVAAGGDPLTIYVSNGDRDEVHQFSPAGDLQRIFRRTIGPIPITDEERERAKAAILESNRSARREALDALPPQDFHPPVNGLLVDATGYLWVRHNSGRWSVFHPEGRWLGTLTLPFRGRAPWVGEDLILGVRSDPDTGVERVEGYRLNR